MVSWFITVYLYGAALVLAWQLLQDARGRIELSFGPVAVLVLAWPIWLIVLLGVFVVAFIAIGLDRRKGRFK